MTEEALQRISAAFAALRVEVARALHEGDKPETTLLLGELMVRQRTTLGIPPTQLAREIGTDLTNYLRLENKPSNVTAHMMDRLARALGLPFAVVARAALNSAKDREPDEDEPVQQQYQVGDLVELINKADVTAWGSGPKEVVERTDRDLVVAVNHITKIRCTPDCVRLVSKAAAAEKPTGFRVGDQVLFVKDRHLKQYGYGPHTVKQVARDGVLLFQGNIWFDNDEVRLAPPKGTGR